MNKLINNETLEEVVKGKEQYLLSALLNYSGSYCEFNVTKDRMIGTPLVIVDGVMDYQENVYQDLQLGKLSDYVKFFAKNYMFEDRERMLSICNPKSLLEMYAEGKEFISLLYKLRAITGEEKWTDRKIILYQDEKSNDVLGFSYSAERSQFTEIEQQNIELKEKVNSDYLTGCYNRRYLEEYADNYLSLEDAKGYFVLLDVDHFKQVNDTVGHALGDALLKEIVENIQSVFQDDSFVARLGEDEFVVFVTGNHSVDEIKEKLRTLLHKCRKNVTIDYSNSFKISLSIGVSCFPQDAITLNSLYRKADKALYYAKECGRNYFVFHNELDSKMDTTNNTEITESFWENKIDSNFKNMLDSLQSTGVYVITAEEHRILFYNRKVKEVSPHIEVGMICHEVWEGSCENCPIDIIQENAKARTINYNDPFGEVVEITATRVLWNNRIPAFLIRVFPHIDNPKALKQTEVLVKGTAIATYVIDEKYDIVSVSCEVKNLFSNVNIGQKCYKCFFERNTPCENCARNTPQLQSLTQGEKNKIFFSQASPYILENGKMGHMIALYDVPDSTGETGNIIPISKIAEEKDVLTGGYNREGYLNALYNLREKEVDLTRYAIVFVNIRGFKAVNKIFGYEAGDNLLRSLYMKIYTSDLRPDIGARKESDHFIYLIKKELLNLTLLEEILKYRWNYQGQEYLIHCRGGIYYIDNPKESIQDMIDYARIANEYIKDGYASYYYVYNNSLGENYLEQSEILSSYGTAFKNREFYVMYQPVIDVKTEKIVSAEVLVRWKNQKKGMISPGAFIPILERYGHITKLDYFVMRTVNNFVCDRIENHLPIVPLSINLSRVDFVDATMVIKMIEQVKSNSFIAEYLRYELTETSYVDLESNKSELWHIIKSMGSKVLLDDFGDGYSSFGTIQNYDFDILKIDISFVQQIETNAKARSVIEMIIYMCHKLDIEVIAEGVETKEQVEFLKAQDCDYIQGYYYSKPLSETEFVKYIEENI